MKYSTGAQFRAFSFQIIGGGFLCLTVACTSVPVPTNRGVIDVSPPPRATVVKASGIAAEYHLTGPDTIVIAARGGRDLQPDLVKRFAMLRAAEVTLDTSATRFRIVKVTQEDISRRRTDENKDFSLRLDIQTNRTGQPIAKQEAWYSAQKMVDGLGQEVKAEFEKFGVERQ
jgi:hypothetical protein